MLQLDIESVRHNATKLEIEEAMLPVYKKGDRIVFFLVLFHVVFSFILVQFYDTWAVTLGVVIPTALIYFLVKTAYPFSFFSRVISGATLQTFMMLHVYQMHGLAEMHFFFFTSAAIMIVFMDWVAMVPVAIYVSIQHIGFMLLQNQGFPIFFAEDSYISFTKGFFHYCLGAFQIVISSFWAYLFRVRVLENYFQNKALAKYSEEQLGVKDALLRTMILDLGNLAGTVKNSYKEIVYSSREVSSSLQHITEATSTQTNLAENTVSESQRLGDTIQSVLKKAEIMIEKSQLMRTENQSGMKLIHTLKKNFLSSQASNEEVKEAIQDLASRYRDIASIIEKIKSIADQTHLLSLNASIEAARAGDMGRGFAVVATEVGKLADESSRSTKEIYTIVTQINQSIQIAKKEMTESDSLMRSSEESVRKTVDSFQEIEKSVNEVVSQNESFLHDLELMNELKSNTISNSKKILDEIQNSASSTEEIYATTNEQSNIIQSILDQIHELEEKIQKISSTL